MSNKQEGYTIRRPDAMLEHRIRQRAYELYEARMSYTAADDWFQAEREILTNELGVYDNSVALKEADRGSY